MEKDKLILGLCNLINNYRELAIKYCETIKTLKYNFKADITAKEMVLTRDITFEKQRMVSKEDEYDEILHAKNEKIKELENKCELFQEKVEELDTLIRGVSYLEGEIDILKMENQKLFENLEKYRKTYDELLR